VREQTRAQFARLSLVNKAGALSAGATTKCFLTGEVNNSSSEILFAAVTNRRAAQAGA